MSRLVHARRTLTPLVCGPIAAAITLAGASSTARCEESSTATETTSAAVSNARTVEFIGVFVDKASAKALRAAYPTTDKHIVINEDDPLFVVLKYQPTEEEKHSFAPLMGRSAVLKVQGEVQDETTHAILVDVRTEEGGPITLETARGSAFPHITMASEHGQDGFNSGVSSVLLERLHASGHLQWVLEHQDAVGWEGELPAFESTHLPLFNPFPPVQAALRPVQTEPRVIKGTVCTSTQYDAASERCVLEDGETKQECGFCKFMKAGPCADPFIAWEACLDRCKKDQMDFITECGVETLGLRDCVDAHPEYYQVLKEPNNGEEESMSEE